MKALKCLFGPVVLTVVGCSSPPRRDTPDSDSESVASAPAPGNSDDRGGCVAILIDRRFGTWREYYADVKGGILGSAPRENRPRLSIDGQYSIWLGFVDGQAIWWKQSFAAGTPI